MFGKFELENATCTALLSDGTTKTITADLECDANYEHWYEKVCDEYGYYEEFWEVDPYEESIKPLNTDEYIRETNNLPDNISVIKIISYDDSNGYAWELINENY